MIGRKKDKPTQQEVDAANEWVKEVNSDEADEWQSDEESFEYRRLEVGEEMTGVFLGTTVVQAVKPFTVVRFKVDDEIIGIPLYFAIQRFLQTHKVNAGAKLKLLNKGLKDLTGGHTLNVIDIKYRPTDKNITKIESVGSADQTELSF